MKSTMIQWKNKFDRSALERGEASYLNKKVTDFEKVKGGYRAAVLGRQRNEVSVRVREDGHMRLNCSCPVAKGGKSCEHMAAVLYAIEMEEGGGEARLAQEKAAAEAAERQKAERDRRQREEEEHRAAQRAAREQRKSERARRQEEQRLKAEQARAQEVQKRLAEEERREKIRRQKEEEARRKTEKKQKEAKT